MNDEPFCRKCGKATTSLPTRSFGGMESGCSDLDCTGVHPYFIIQEVIRLRVMLADVTNKFLLHEQEDDNP